MGTIIALSVLSIGEFMIKKNEKKVYPILPLRNTVLFPQQIFPVYIGREQSLNLIDSLPKQGKKYIGLNLEPDYKTMKAIEEADANESPAPRTVDKKEEEFPF